METVTSPVPYRLETLGTLALRGPQKTFVAADGRQQRRRLALLAVLASAGERGRSRDQLLLLFWPDSTEKKARHSLDQLLYAIRTSLDDSIFSGVNPIRLNPSVIDADLWQFESCIAKGNQEPAVSIYSGPFLDGFHSNESLEFQDWLDTERRRLTAKYLDALETLATDAERQRDLKHAVMWRTMLVEAEPLSTRHALGFVQSLASAGDFAAALEFASRYERTARRELGIHDIPDLKKLVAEIQTRPASSVPTELVERNVPVLEHSRSDHPTKSSQASIQKDKSAARNFRVSVAATVGLAVMLLAGFIYVDKRSAIALPVSRQSSAITPVAYVNTDRAASGTRSVAAYDLYVRGQDPVLLRSDSTAVLGFGYLNKAIALDSGFAAAYAGLAQMYVRLAFSSDPPLSQSELRDRAEASARRAIALDDSLAEGHQALGLVETFWMTDLKDGEKELRRALDLNPHLSHTLEYLGLDHVLLGKSSEALADAERAVAEDPLSPINKAVLAQMLYVNNRCDDALPILDSLDEMKPALLRVAIARSACLAVQGKWTDAARAVRDQSTRDPAQAIAMLGFSLARAGSRSEALEIRSRLRAKSRTNAAALYDAAVVSFGLGEIDTALTEVDSARGAGPFPYVLMGPLFSSLHSDARFRSIANRRGVQLASKD